VKVDHLYGHVTLRPHFACVITDGGGKGRGYVDISLIEVLIIAAILGILGALGYGLYRESLRPSFELKKDDWACSRSHQESTTIYMNMGSGNNIMMMPITTWHTVCDEWRRTK
jgi:hypothetical protein